MAGRRLLEKNQNYYCEKAVSVGKSYILCNVDDKTKQMYIFVWVRVCAKCYQILFFFFFFFSSVREKRVFSLQHMRNSCSTLMIFLPTEAYVVFCDYFKIFFWSTDFKYSWFKHKLKLFVFKCTVRGVATVKHFTLIFTNQAQTGVAIAYSIHE